ncbi:unnamed protein product, partial [Mesorhabditis spiculigera]
MGSIIFWVNTSSEIPKDTSEWVFDILQATTLLTTAANLFGIYLFYYHSTNAMRGFGTVLSAYQCAATLTDLMVGSALAPYLIFPCPGGLPTGWLKFFGVSTFVQLFLGALCLAQMMSLMVTMFIVRQQYILPLNTFFKLTERSKYVVYTILMVSPTLHLIVIMVYFRLTEDFEAAKEIYLQLYPKLKQFIKDPHFLAFSPKAAWILLYNIGVWVFLAILGIAEACVTCFYVLAKRKRSISPRTLRTYHRIIFKILIQVSIPFITLLIPILGAIYVFMTDNFGWITLMPFGVALFAQHAFLSTLMSIYLYRPYYSFVIRLCKSLMRRIIPRAALTVFKINETSSIPPVKVAPARRFSMAISASVSYS